MLIIDIAYGILFLTLGVSVIKSDLSIGLILNKTLLIFTAIAALLDVIYYIFFAKDQFISFAVNVAVILCISVSLFYTHIFAGGDSKLAIVLSICYPAGFYLKYDNSNITLIGTIGLAIIFAFVYLLIFSLKNIISSRTNWNSKYIKKSLIMFLQSFIVAMLYICVINLIVITAYKYGITLNSWIVRIISLIVAWTVGKNRIFRKRIFLITVLLIDVIGGILLRTVPLSLIPTDYILVIILLICRMSIGTCIYERMEICNLKKGMILSTASSALMQGSRIRGLPSISTEDLKSRLSDEEVESICRWASSHKISEVSVVRKIPFAIFLVIGYLGYFVLWCIF